MRILGIETSADETAAAVVEDGRKLLSNVVASSLDLHKAYGGIVPEIAARSHLEVIIPVINQALSEAFQGQALERDKMWSNIDAIAVTQGPGLLGSLLIGVLTAKTLAIAKNKPLIPVNHVHAHVYASFIIEKANSQKLVANSLNDKQPKFPLLALIVSGGHTQLVRFESHKKYRLLGQTTDDAAGEAYDKVAKMLGLPYPGGPSVSKAAEKGNHTAYVFPIAKMENRYDFSFSGLKTAVLRAAQTSSGHDYTFPSSKLPKALSEAQKADLAASFQRTINQTLANTLVRAAEGFNPKSIVVAGGVAASQTLRETIDNRLQTVVNLRGSSSESPRIIYPPIELCTDNAGMVAALAYFQQKAADPFKLEVDPSLSM